MRGQPISQWNSRPAQVAGVAPEVGARRSAHGGNAWSLPLGTNPLRQPQDGAPSMLSAGRGLLASIRKGNPLAEPDDASLTGGTRSLTRRLLGLNVTGRTRKSPLAVVGMSQRQVA